MSLTATSSWQSQAITKDEVWQCTDGCAQLFCSTAGAPAASDQGVELRLWESVRFTSGQTIYYKLGRSKAAKKGVIHRLEVNV